LLHVDYSVVCRFSTPPPGLFRGPRGYRVLPLVRESFLAPTSAGIRSCTAGAWEGIPTNVRARWESRTSSRGVGKDSHDGRCEMGISHEQQVC